MQSKRIDRMAHCLDHAASTKRWEMVAGWRAGREAWLQILGTATES